MPVCCAGKTHCGRVEIDPGLAHKCMNCGGFAHGAFCSIEWSERDSHGIHMTDVHAKAKTKENPLPKAMVQHLNSSNNREDLCLKCLEDVRKKLSAASTKVPAAHTISVRATATRPESAKAVDVSAAAYPFLTFTTTTKKTKEGAIDLTADAPATKEKKKKDTTLKAAPTKKNSQIKPPRKTQTRLTIHQKLEVLEFIERGSSIKEACKKFGCSKQSVSAWKKDKDNLIKATKFNGKATRVVKDDGLMRIKTGILAFYDLNKLRPKDDQISITSESMFMSLYDLCVSIQSYMLHLGILSGDVISAQAKMIREHLLERHKESPFLTDDEVEKMQECQFSQSWGIKLMKRLPGEAGSVDVEKATPQIDKFCTLIAEYCTNYSSLP
jgi:hypothetical protein